MNRRPPRPTLLPQNDALPTSQREVAPRGDVQRADDAVRPDHRTAAADAHPGDLHAAAHVAEQRDEVGPERSEEHTSELQSRQYLVCRLLLETNNALSL